jgi:hypothetical protein
MFTSEFEVFINITGGVEMGEACSSISSEMNIKF